VTGRKLILWLLAVGIVVLLALSLLPQTFTQIASIRENVESKLSSTKPSAARSAEPAKPRTPQFDVSSWYKDHNEQPDTHGVLIESLDGSKLIASHNPDVTFNPASLIKLSTTLAVLRKLGPNYRFETKLTSDGAVDKSGVLQGDLYVSGNDPSFGDATAAALADQLKQKGIKKLGKQVIVSSSFCFNFTDKPEESGARLVKALNRGNPKVVVGDSPAGETIATVNSNPLKDILLYMNAHSSNFIAEHLGDMIGGPEGLQTFLINDVGLSPDQVSIERTSGREHNRMTPRGLLTVIRGLMAETKKDGIEPSDILAIASDDSGTLKRRLEGTGLEGSVVAKTGTLTHEVDGGMASLAGIVYTKDAGPVLFAILDQGNRIAENRQLEDQMLGEIIHQIATPQIISSPTPRKLLPSSNLSVDKSEKNQEVE